MAGKSARHATQSIQPAIALEYGRAPPGMSIEIGLVQTRVTGGPVWEPSGGAIHGTT